MNVVYSTSDNYAPLAGISLTSLLENNKAEESIHIIIMDNGISEDNKIKLKRTAKTYGRDISFVPLSESLSDIKINVQKWNISTFGRLFEAFSLPKIDKVIHIDCDTVICGSLCELWNIDMEEYVIAGASDCLSDDYKTNIGLSPEDVYINAGVLVINLDRIRKLKLEEKFLKYIQNNNDFLTYVDQEVLNSCIPKDEKKILPLRVNAYSIIHFLSYEQLKRLRHVNNMFPEEEFQDAVKNPVIIHYTGCFLEGTRPWIRNDRHPKRNIFLHYKEISQWDDMNEWDDERTIIQKTITYISNICPKTLLATIIGIIHGIIIPKINGAKRKNING